MAGEPAARRRLSRIAAELSHRRWDFCKSRTLTAYQPSSTLGVMIWHSALPYRMLMKAILVRLLYALLVPGGWVTRSFVATSFSDS